MPDVQKLQNQKEKILSVIRLKGPSFPTRIAKETGLSPLFAGAFLSELVAERKLKISDMRVGASPLYYINGQEHALENFTEHLNQKEKEAFHLLKSSQVLKDEDMEPAIRVALRKIKDFAVPVNISIDGQSKIFWKHYLVPDNELKEKIESSINTPQIQTKTSNPEIREPINQPETKETKIEEKGEVVEKIKEDAKKEPVKENIFKNKTKEVASKFATDVEDYLAFKDVEILEKIMVKKKEYCSKVRHDTIFGKQEHLLIAKDKKKITTDDLVLALQQAQSQKMPALIISPGEIDKNAKSYLEEWRNFLKFEKIKI